MNVAAVYQRRCLLLAVLTLSGLTSHAVAAQQAPLTGQMMDGTSGKGTATAPMATTSQTAGQATTAQVDQGAAGGSAVGSAATSVGSTTRRLLDLQASGSLAGKRLPMLGDQASAAYVRYLKSFEHPIPEFYQTSVGKSSGRGGGISQGP